MERRQSAGAWDGHMGRRGKLVKTQAPLMFVGGVLTHSKGGVTPSSLRPFLGCASVGISIQTQIDDDTCRGIRIKVSLT